MSLTSFCALGGAPVCLVSLLKSQHSQVVSEILSVEAEHRSASIRSWQRIQTSLRAKTDLFNHRFKMYCEILVCKRTLVLYLLQGFLLILAGHLIAILKVQYIYAVKMIKTFITVEKVICIIYAVFSTIISDILDRFYFQLSYLIHAWKINFISFIYLPMLKLSFKSSSSEQFDCCSCMFNYSPGRTVLNVLNVRKINEYELFD